MPARWLAVLVLCSSIATTAPTQQSTYVISGMVVQEGSNLPLKHVLVTITQIEKGGQSASVITGSDGRFTFTNVPKGKYSLEGQQRNGPAEFFRGDEGFSTAIATGPGIDSEHIVFPLAPRASISGTVTDDQSDPVANGQVILLRQGVSNGREQTIRAGQTSTDAGGSFYFGHLRPGTYFIAVKAHPWYARYSPAANSAGQSAGRNEMDVAFPLTYYPDAIDPASASPITLAEGGTFDARIMLRAVPALHVRITGGPERKGYANGVIAFQLGPGGVMISPSMAMMNGRGAGQELMGIAPGQYVLMRQNYGRNQVSSSARKIVDLTADGTIDLDDGHAPDISGAVRFEGGGKPEKTGIMLLDERNNATVYAPIQSDGSFQIEHGVLPGRYSVRVNAAGWYLKSVAAKGAAYTAGELEVPDRGTIQLSLTLAQGLYNVNGTVLRDGKPFAGALVAAIPENPNYLQYIGRDQSDSDGTFTLRNLAPGRYTVVAIDDGRELAFRDPAVMKPYLAQGQALNVPAGTESNLKINVQSRQR